MCRPRYDVGLVLECVAIMASLTFVADVIPPVQAQVNWSVSYTDVDVNRYAVTFAWDHDPAKAVMQWTKGGKLGVCEPGHSSVASDGKPYWLPRFYPFSVPSEVTLKTGIVFGSVDWQPCGHKDIVICHAEAHYDFHLYYVSQTELETYTCTPISASNPTCKGLEENASAKDKDFFSLMEGNVPKNFCVDLTSAMPNSGIHYGSRSDTLNEWREPVTILGSHDCKLTFFEPMLSWRWINNDQDGGRNDWSGGDWPSWKSGPLKYEKKLYSPLPDSWNVSVSRSCASCSYSSCPQTCRISVTAEGVRCPASGCPTIERKCARVKECSSSQEVGYMSTTDTAHKAFGDHKQRMDELNGAASSLQWSSLNTSCLLLIFLILDMLIQA